jgi:hypothetical protein
MAAIAFSKQPQEGWVVAGWVLRQVLDDVASQHPDDLEMVTEFALAKESSGISVYSLEPRFAHRITSAIKETVTGILAGTVRSGIQDQPFGDARTLQQYRETLQELLQIIPSHEGYKSGRVGDP